MPVEMQYVIYHGYAPATRVAFDKWTDFTKELKKLIHAGVWINNVCLEEKQ